MIMCTCKPSFPQIIAVTSRKLCRRPFLEQIERICEYRPKGIILREKDLDENEYTLLAKQVLDITRRYRIPCILHTYVRTARMLHCPAIHLPLPLLREYAGLLRGYAGQALPSDVHRQQTEPPDADCPGYFREVGCSVHHCNEAAEAVRLGATYLTAGHIYSTDCKKGVPPRGLSFLREICQSVSVPVYAIGGIRLDGTQLQEIRDCGAAGGCVMSGMMGL